MKGGKWKKGCGERRFGDVLVERGPLKRRGGEY